jgi:hypothetical protein
MRWGIILLLAVLFVFPAASSAQEAPAESDSSMTLKGDQEGTVFDSLTIEGEDKVQVEYARPPLDIEIDARDLPGLEWGNAQDVLNRTVPDLGRVVLDESVKGRVPGLARPWLDGYRDGAVAIFRPQLEDVKDWKLTIADSRGDTVRTFAGRGNPPKAITWDGRYDDGKMALPGLTYSYVVHASDRAGNRRNFVGQGFTIPSYRQVQEKQVRLAMTAEGLLASSGAAGNVPAAMLLEAASWVNQVPGMQAPVEIVAMGRNHERAEALAQHVQKTLEPLLLGDPARVRATTEVRADAPAEGAVLITAGR